MNRLLVSSPFALAMLFAFSSQAWASEPGYCDPATDPHECACGEVEEGYVCESLRYNSFDDLIQSDDPEALRDAANIHTEFDGDLGVYVVNVNVEHLNTVGVMFSHPNQGRWDSEQELLDYVYTLLGVEQQVEYQGVLPPMRVVQKGVVHRLQRAADGTATWTGVFGDLVLDAVSGPNGGIWIGDHEFRPPLDPIYWSPVTSCPQTMSHHHKYKTVGPFRAHQCTYQGEKNLLIKPGGCNPIVNKDCKYTTVKERLGFNKTYGFSLNNGQTVETCETAYDANGNPFSKCKEEGILTRRYVRADNVELESMYVLKNVGSNTYPEVESSVSASHTRLVQDSQKGYISPSSNLDIGPRGVCGSSVSQKAGHVVTLKTERGRPSSHSFCP